MNEGGVETLRQSATKARYAKIAGDVASEVAGGKPQISQAARYRAPRVIAQKQDGRRAARIFNNHGVWLSREEKVAGREIKPLHTFVQYNASQLIRRAQLAAAMTG